jgi:DNA-binding MltR family transcriptional regulator
MRENIKDINLKNFEEKIEKESDRGVVLISAEFIDIFLTNLFKECLNLDKDIKKVILEGPTAILNSFSNKIKIAYSIGLIDKNIYENLECVRKIRNMFAHRIFDASFEDPEIIKICKKIRVPNIIYEESMNYRVLFYKTAYFLAGCLFGLVDKKSKIYKQ